MTLSALTTLLRLPFLALCIIYSKIAMSLKRSDIEQKKAEVGEKNKSKDSCVAIILMVSSCRWLFCMLEVRHTAAIQLRATTNKLNNF